MKEKIVLTLKNILQHLMETGALPRFEVPAIQVVRPTEESFGDYTTNIALITAKLAGMNPHALAEIVVQEFVMPEVARAEIAGPGHINFSLSDTVYAETLAHILKDGARYGNSMQGDGEKVNNEFISANPTGPLHLGNGRGGFYADSLARVMKKAGYDVMNEYYVNDAGEQVMKLGHSILKDSEAVYAGEYIDKLNEEHLKDPNNQGRLKEYLEWDTRADLDESEKLLGKKLDRIPREAGEWAAHKILEGIIKPITKDVMRVHFDVWTSERQLIADGYIDKALAILKEKKLTFEQDGALWLRTIEFGDDKDRVLVKSDGSKTYFASDAGYILNKMERGFTLLVETWGADHHGYVSRFQAVAKALGFTGEIHFIIVQLVKLVKDGQEVRMSKRAGNVVSIEELIETVGHDVARFFFLMYSPDTHMNFDLGLAEERSDKNPVYYVQYAHARLASMFRKADEASLVPSAEHLKLLMHPKERLLIRELMAFPELVERMAAEQTVHQLPQYAVRLADRLHSFYADCKVIDASNAELSGARLALMRVTKTVLAETLRLMGIGAPEAM
jgi:arginyl-tRNA synthetase